MDPKIIEAVVAPAFLLIGLSHLLQPRLWVRFFDHVRQTGLAAVIIPLYTLPLALVLVVGHNLWMWGWPLFLTVAGWGMLIKSTLYLLIPGLADRVLEKKMTMSDRSFQIVGAIVALICGILTCQAWTQSPFHQRSSAVPPIYRQPLSTFACCIPSECRPDVRL
jgi:hypothetical protein